MRSAATNNSLRSAAVAAGGAAGIRVLAVSDVALVAEGLARLLPDHGYAASAAVAGAGQELLEQVRLTKVDAVLMDGTIDRAPELVRALSSPPQELAVVVVGLPSASAAYELLSAGALSYLGQEASAEELEQALAAAVRGEAVVPPRLVGELLRRTLRERQWSTPRPLLTRREAEIAELLRGGKSNKAIAEELQIEVSTVKNHVHSILGKLGVQGRRELQLERTGREETERRRSRAEFQIPI